MLSSFSGICIQLVQNLCGSANISLENRHFFFYHEDCAGTVKAHSSTKVFSPAYH